MGCPYLDNQVDIEAELLRNALHQGKIFRLRLDVLPEEYVITLQHSPVVHHLFSVHIRHAAQECKGMSFCVFKLPSRIFGKRT